MKKIKLMLSMFVVLCFTVSVFAMPKDFKGNFEKGANCTFKKCDMQNDDIMFVLTMFDCPQHENNFGSGHHFENGMREHKNFNPIDARLNLTDEQKTKLKELKDKEFTLKKEFADKIKALNEEFAKEKLDDKTIKNKQKEIKKLSQEYIDNYVNNKKQIREILSFEQYNKMFTKKTRYDMLAERLNLNDEQKEKIKNLFEQNREKNGNLKKTLFEDKIKLEKELEKETADTDTVNNLSNEISRISQDIVKNDIDMKIELKNILTAEQYNKFTAPHKHFKGHKKHQK